MDNPIIITSRVVETIKSLPVKEREKISNALAQELILGEDPRSSLTPIQGILYAMIRFYVRSDSERGFLRMAANSSAGI